jgi:hypothetical protein
MKPLLVIGVFCLAFAAWGDPHSDQEKLRHYLAEEQAIRPMVPHPGADYDDTPVGFRVQKSCSDLSWNLNKILHQTLREGLSCLEKFKTSKANDNIADLLNVLTTTPPPILLCAKPYTHLGDAHASTPNEQEEKKTAFIALNMEAKPKLEERNEEEIKAALFHQIFHLMGKFHYVDFEFADACSIWCFPKNPQVDKNPQKEALKTLAERICEASYKEGEEHTYFSELLGFAEILQQPFLALEGLKNLMVHQPKDREARVQFLKGLRAGPELAMGIAWANVMKKDAFPYTEKEKKVIEAVRKKGRDLPDMKNLVAKAQPVMEAFQAQLNHQPEKAWKLLQKAQLPTPADLPSLTDGALKETVLSSFLTSVGMVARDLAAYYRAEGQEKLAKEITTKFDAALQAQSLTHH